MDTENYRLAQLLFKNENNDNLIELIQNPEFNKYVSKIGAYTVQDLSKEPTRLKNEKQTILEHTQDLAFKNYKTFVQTAECSRNIFKQFCEVEHLVDTLSDKIPELEKKCEEFIDVTKDISKSRRLNSLTLTRNAQLLEILELPQLMDSFIREEQYENALELTNYVRRLGVKHPEITIFKSIVADVNKSWLVMLQQLLEQLRSDIHLPKCLEVVGYLRRMEVFTEGELRLKFLQARDAWFKQTLLKITITEPNQRLNKIIELTRVGLFSITTQYRAIFNDDEHGIVNASMDKRFNENVIFYSWLHEKISLFLLTLRTELKHGINSIDSIISQCMYFGLSFSRVGCDFRGLMVPIFVEVVKENFERSVSKATREFERNMERFTLINKKAPSALWKGNENDDSLHPPESLLEFYPLAEYCNQVLTTFNELKLCTPYAIVQDVTKSLQNSLVIVSKTILVFYGQEQQAFSVTAKEAFVRLCVCFTGDLIPYFQKCLHVLYPPNSIATQLGISVPNVNREGLVALDKTTITEPISHLLPTKIEPNINVDDITESKVEIIENKCLISESTEDMHGTKSDESNKKEDDSKVVESLTESMAQVDVTDS